MEELQNLQNLHQEKLRLENFTAHHSSENMYSRDYTSMDNKDDRAGMTNENNVMLIRRVINTGMQGVSCVTFVENI